MAMLTPELLQKITPHCAHHPTPHGSVQSINKTGLALVADSFEIPQLEAMQVCLKDQIWPLRFVRNAGVFNASAQSALLDAHVFVAGCGGLGGYVATLLARAGVGAITLCDGDAFSESNLNRQALCREDNLGQNKAEVTAGELARIASHARLIPLVCMLTPDNALSALRGADLAVDCLDSLAARKVLATAAAKRGIAFIHGAIAGHEGFISLVRPTDNTMHIMYGSKTPGNEECAEHTLGVPTVTPAITAALQVALALQELTGGVASVKTLYHLDVLAPLLEHMQL